MWRRVIIHRRVIVNLKSGSAIAGILRSEKGRVLELRDAVIIDPATGRSTPAAGAVYLDRRDVDFVQDPGEADRGSS